jgi:hypothetical protein
MLLALAIMNRVSHAVSGMSRTISGVMGEVKANKITLAI